MANKKFSEFTLKTNSADVDFVVGYDGSDNVRIDPANLGGAVAFLTPESQGTVSSVTLGTISTMMVNEWSNYGSTGELYTNSAGEALVSVGDNLMLRSLNGNYTTPMVEVSGTTGWGTINYNGDLGLVSLMQAEGFTSWNNDNLDAIVNSTSTLSFVTTNGVLYVTESGINFTGNGTNTVSAVLTVNDKVYLKSIALVDGGNALYDPLTGKYNDAGQLKQITESGNTGYRIYNENFVNYYGTIGNNAIDLTIQDYQQNRGATGQESFAAGKGSHASNYNSTAIGFNVQATGNSSFAAGMGGQASGTNSVTVGTSNNATAGNSASIGHNNTASGNQSYAIGYANQSTVADSYTFGRNNRSTGSKALSIGYDNDALIAEGISIGNGNVVTSNSGISIGKSSTASGPYNSISLGNLNTASGNTAVTIGTQNQATQQSSVALGVQSWATQINSVAVGTIGRATGSVSSAFGYSAKATNERTTSIGAFSEANGSYSTALGYKAVANETEQIVIGNENLDSADAHFIIGNGSGGTKSNVFEILNDGTVVFIDLPSSTSYSNDTDAATGGVPIGGIYRDNNDLKVRLT